MSAAQNPSDLPKGNQSTTAVSTTTLTIPNRTGHRRTLNDFFVKDGASGYSQIQIGNNTMMRIYDNLAQAKFVEGTDQKYLNMGFLGYLAKMIPDFPKPNAAQDESIVFTRDSTFDLMLANWADEDSGDVTSRTKPGGSQSKKQLFILNMSNAATVTVTTPASPIAQQDMPTGVSIFSDNNRISANNKFTVYCVAANVPVNVNSKTTRVHIFDDFTELFTSETNQGLLVDPSLVGELGFDLNPPSMKWLDTPYVFMPNSRLTITADMTIAGGNNLSAGTQQVFLIGIREIIGGGA